MKQLLRGLWWLQPAWPFAVIVGVTMVVAWLQSEDAFRLYRTPKYVEFWHVGLAAAAIFAFALGCRIGDRTGKVPEPSTDASDDRIRWWFYATTLLSLFGSAAWLAVGVKNGFRLSTVIEFLTTDNPEFSDNVRTEMFPTMSGVTTCTQFGLPAVLLGMWLIFRGDRKAILGTATLLLVAMARAVVFSERTALIELIVPGAILALRMCVLGREWPTWFIKGMKIAPIMGPVVLVVFFGSFEYFRSWRYYQDEFDSFSEFTVWRLAGYYTTAHNNGAMAIETDQPRPLPYYCLRSLWLFPGVRSSPFDYKTLTGLDVEANHTRMLKRFGNFELNNEGGFFQPAIEFGIAGSLLFWLGYGLLSGRLHRSFLVGNITGVVFYPIVYFTILEVPLVLIGCYPRLFPAIVILALVTWTSRGSKDALRSVASPPQTNRILA